MAFQQAEILDNQGVEDGTYWLGYMYHRGIGTNIDIAKAKGILHSLAKIGNIPAKIELSMIKFEEEKKDDALNELKKIAVMECISNSCTTLASLYEQQKKIEDAYFWLLLASHFEQDSTSKQTNHIKTLQDKLSKEIQSDIENKAYNLIENMQ